MTDVSAYPGRPLTPHLVFLDVVLTLEWKLSHCGEKGTPNNAAEVVGEMRYLYDRHDVTIFLFQDDDFPLFGPRRVKIFMRRVDRT
jgi:hypothetical protein